MPVPSYQKRARHEWRQRRRDAGYSWFCVATNHAVCSGFKDRLQQLGELRPPCKCPCHDDEAYLMSLEDDV